MKRFSHILTLVMPLAGLAVGCGETISVPSPDSTSIMTSDSLAPQPSAAILTVAFVVPDGVDLEGTIWEQLFRYEAANRKVLVDVVHTPAGEQAPKVRELIDRGLSAAVIVPDPGDAELAEAIRALADAKIPVVLMNRAVSIEGLDVPVARYSSVDEDAKAIVSAAVEEARKMGFPDDGEAVIVTNGPFDQGGRDRVAALERALADTSLKVLPTLSFSGYVDAARTVFEPLVQEHPGLSVVIFEEEQAARAVATVRSIRTEADPEYRGFAIAGFGHAKELVRMIEANQFSALAQRDPERLTRRAFQTAWTLARGQALTEPAELKTAISVATGPRDNRFFENMAKPAVTESGEVGDLGVDGSGGSRPRPRPKAEPLER